MSFKFRQTDHDWPDHDAMTKERYDRLHLVTTEIAEAILPILQKHHYPGLNIKATVIPIFSVAIRGDARKVQPIVALFMDQKLDYDFVLKISNEITNTLPVSRVIYYLGNVEFRYEEPP